MKKEIRDALMSKRTTSKVRMKLGISPVTLTLSKPKQTPMETDENKEVPINERPEGSDAKENSDDK